LPKWRRRRRRNYIIFQNCTSTSEIPLNNSCQMYPTDINIHVKLSHMHSTLGLVLGIIFNIYTDMCSLWH